MERRGYGQVQQPGHLTVHQRVNNREMRPSVPFLFTLLAVVSCVIAVTATGILLSVKGKTNQERQQAWSIDKPVCIPCYLIENQLEKTTQDDTKMCCANNSDEMSALLKLVVRQRNLRPTSTPLAKDSVGLVMANKRLLPQQKDYQDKGQQRRRTIKISENESNTEKLQGVKIEKDAFVIQYTGTYYVYANLIPSNKNNKKIDAEIVLTRGMEQPKILAKVNNGAVMFKLFKGDRLQIVMSSLSDIQFEEKSSYAGVVMLAGS